MSYRRLRVILEYLPSDSAFRTAVRDGMDPLELKKASESSNSQAYGRWSLSDMLLAQISDGIEGLKFMQSDGKGAKPKPYPRPGVARAGDVAPINAAARAYMQYIRDHHGASPPADWKPPATG